MVINVSVGRKEGIFLVFLVSVFLIAGLGIAYNSGGPPETLGHSDGELERYGCIREIVTSAGQMAVFDLDEGGVNICNEPHGCEVTILADSEPGGAPGYPSNKLRYVQNSASYFIMPPGDENYVDDGTPGDSSAIYSQFESGGCAFNVTGVNEMTLYNNPAYSSNCEIMVCPVDY